MNLNNFLNPASIAIIGASNNKKKIGYQLLANLKEGGYRGRIYPVNLNDSEVSGLKAYQSINDIKAKVDLAVIVVPAVIAVEEVKKCAVAKIKNIVIISANFSESSPAGRELEEKITSIGLKNNLNILGPNCLGFINYRKNINLTFAKTEKSIFNKPKFDGNKTAFISQSGAIGSAVLDWSVGKKMGWSYFVSLGNKAVLNENDFFKFFSGDRDTNLVVAYLEEIKKGEEFMEIVSGFGDDKKVVILKAGQSKAGSQAALSHTGSMAGSYEAYLAGVKRVGVLALDSLEDVFNLINLWQRPAHSENSDLYIVSNAGGPLVIATDLASQVGISFGKFLPKTREKIIKSLPELKVVKNPLDVLGDADAVRYRRALSAVLADKKVSNLLVMLTPQTSTEIMATTKEIVRLGKKYKNKMICAVFIGGQGLKEAKDFLMNNFIPCFDYPRQAIFALSGYLRLMQPALEKKYISVSTDTRLDGKKQVKISQMDYLQSFKFLKKYDIPAVPVIRIKSMSDLEKLSYPTVLKIVGERIIHKSDQNLIALNLKNHAEANKAFCSWQRLLRDKNNYCVAQKMETAGTELIVGFKRDESFGPIIIVGAGGIYTEILQDIEREVSDVSYASAWAMIKKLRIYPILKGARGQVGYDISELAKTIVKVAKIARENPEIVELDINPLFAKKKGVAVADIRIITGSR